MNRKVTRRKADMWISNNKVLVGGGLKKQHSRNPNFETEETKLLISLWGDPKIQKTLITTHKKHPVIAQLAEKMRKHGYYRSPEEINTRIKNLKCFYNRIKKDVELGIINEPTWKHYPAMDEILNRPIFGNRMQQQQQERRWREEFDQSDLANEELRPEDLLTVEEKAEMQEEKAAKSDTHEPGLVVPKDEPLDIDDLEMELAIASADERANEDEDNEDKSDVEDIFPKLSAYLKLASNKPPNSAIQLNTTSRKPSVTAATPADIEIKTSPPSTPPPLLFPKTKTPPLTLQKTNGQITPNPNVSGAGTSTSPNKISLVPTNILLKQPQSGQTGQSGKSPQQQQQQQQSQKLTFNPQQLLCSKSPHHPNQFNLSQLSTHLGNGTTQSAVITSSAPGMPMKVILVNTLSKQQQSSMCATATNHATPLLATKRPAQTTTLAATPSMKKPNISQQQQQTTDVNLNKLGAHDNNAEDVNPSNDNSFINGKMSPCFKTLLTQMITLQQKTLELSKERLEVERSRLEWEKSISDRIFGLPFFNKSSVESSFSNSTVNTEIHVANCKLDKDADAK